jgi:predicted Zn-dependent protease
MIGSEKTNQILKQALQASTAEQTEVTLIAHESQLTRFANNYIHQNVAETNAILSVRAVMGKRQGVATTNNLSIEDIERALEAARLAASNQPEDPDFHGLVVSPPPQPVFALDELTSACTPEERAKAVDVICRKAKEKSINGSGYFSTGTVETAIANSLGTMTYHAGTVADISVTAMTNDSAGRAQASAWKVSELNPEAIGDEAIDKAHRGRNPRKIEPGEYTIVAEPYVTDDLIGMLGWIGMSAMAVQEERSWMNDRLGKPAMSSLVSIWDDGNDRAGYPRPFDFEGVLKQRVDIVEKGVVGSPLYDTYTARKEGKESTGHATPMSWGLGPFPLNLFMAEGENTMEEMIQSTKRGLYVATFWYTRPMQPREAVITGMTRDGVFMIENGEIAYPVKNLRFTQSYVEALANVEMVSRETRQIIGEFENGIYASSRVPALKISAFNFTGSTV